jgi:hypothetical protein
MGSINLTNSKGRDAMVATQRVSTTLRLRWLDAKGRQAQSARICRTPVTHDLDALLKNVKAAEPLAGLAEALLTGDPEVDLERTGGFLRDTSRVYVSPDQKIVTAVALWDRVHNADGSERERRAHQAQEQNVATETPLRWSGKLLKKSEVWNRFVFAAKLQVRHVNGLTYDFLYETARELEQKDSLLLVGAGPKANQPLVFQRGGTPYRGFLEGRTRGEAYCLILHLSNMELKLPEKAASPKSEKSEGTKS